MKPRTLLLLAAVGLILAGALTPHWSNIDFSGYLEGGGDFHRNAGLLRYTQCEGESCTSGFLVTNAEVFGPGVLGAFVLLASLAVATLAALTARASHRDHRGPATALLIVAGLTAVFGLGYKLSGVFVPTTWGYSAALWFVGMGAAFAGGLYAQRGLVAPGRMQMVMTPYGVPMLAQVQPCSVCGGPTLFVPQYGKLYCMPCDRYEV